MRDVILPFFIAEGDGISGDTGQRGIKTFTQLCRRTRRRNTAQLHELHKRQRHAVAKHVVFGESMDDPDPGFEVVIHVQAGTGDFDILVAFRFNERELFQLFCHIHRGHLPFTATGGGFQRRDKQAKAHERDRLYRVVTVRHQRDHFAGFTIQFTEGIVDIDVLFISHVRGLLS